MFRFLFSYRGRIARSSFWLGHLLLLVLAIGGMVLLGIITVLSSTGRQAAGELEAVGIVAIIAAVLVMACGALALTGSGICLGIRRYHDRNKPGIWVAIQFVPIIGMVWYVVEAGFLRGTAGANPYGADPFGSSNDPSSLIAAAPAPGGRPGWVVPAMLALALPGLVAMASSAAIAWRSHSWLAAATVIPGQVVELKPVVSTDASKATSYRAVIAATTPEGAAIRLVDSWAVTPPPVIGDARQIAYDGSGPNHAVIVDFWDLYGWESVVGGLAAAFVVPWLAATALVAALWKRRQHPLPSTTA